MNDYCPSCKTSTEFEEYKNPLRMKCKTCGYEMGCLRWKRLFRGQGHKIKELEKFHRERR